MLVTVAICTWNRASLLDQTLARMCQLRIPVGVEWELLVVNNNCTDSTDEVVARYAEVLPLRRLFEPQPGISNARNCALKAAAGELLLWTDDDVLVDADWLEQYVRAAREWPAAAFFGGTVDPWFAVRPPQWINDLLSEIANAYAIRQLGPEVRPFTSSEVPFGANMSFRTHILKKYLFHPNLGRIQKKMLAGEETEVVNRLRAEGHQGVWVGSARVQHYIRAERLTTEYLWKFYCGMSQTLIRERPFPPGKLLFGAPRWAWKMYLQNRCTSWILAPTRSRAWLHAFRQAAFAWGIINEVRTSRTPARSIHPLDTPDTNPVPALGGSPKG